MLKLKENAVRQKIAETGYSVKAWGEKYGFSQTTLSNWLNGTRNIKRDNLEKLAAALHCDIFDIATIVIEINQSRILELEDDCEEIRGMFGKLSAKQRKAILNLTALLVNGNEQIEHYETME
jgi:transcriptional regulator with XRE-family HTH domain